MGCDIHLYVEKKINGKWKNIDKWSKEEDDEYYVEIEDRFYSERNYSLFSILANVRNGVGFAGTDTGDGFVPIDYPRGLPPDISPKLKAAAEDYGFADGHSHSYFTLRELKEYDWNQITVKRGVVEPEQYKKFKENGEPDEWASGVMGPDVAVITNNAMDQVLETGGDLSKIKDLYTKISWKKSYRECCQKFIEETIPRLEKESEGNDDVIRIVFWFDN